MDISITEENHCYENVIAEHVIGILKRWVLSRPNFTKVAHPKKAAKNTINLWNEIRLQFSLDYKTPNMVHKLSA